MSETISVQEIQEMLGISSKYAYALVKSPGFPCVFIGNKCLISRTAFYEWWHDPNQLIQFKAQSVGGDT